MPKIKTLKEPKPLPKYITEKNWKDMMDLEGLGDWWKDVFRMYVTTGMRRSEVLYGCIDGSFLIVPSDSPTKASVLPLSILKEIDLTASKTPSLDLKSTLKFTTSRIVLFWLFTY